MTHFLSSEENPEGHRLEDILSVIRNDVIYRAGKIADDRRQEAKIVMNNNMEILKLLTDAIKLAEHSTSVLDKAFGAGSRSPDGKPRIGS